MNELTFQNATLTLMPIDGEVWVTATDLARALGYEQPNQVTRIYNRNKDEFTGCMSRRVKLTLSGNYQKSVRLFSLRGAHLIAMFARTPVAKAFRRWVLDLLDSLHNGGEYVMERYRQASTAYRDSEQVASDCGKGLSHWRHEKPTLKARLEYWQERQQLCLELN
jgi:prophage antirepressor-like protein